MHLHKVGHKTSTNFRPPTFSSFVQHRIYLITLRHCNCHSEIDHDSRSNGTRSYLDDRALTHIYTASVI